VCRAVRAPRSAAASCRGRTSSDDEGYGDLRDTARTRAGSAGNHTQAERQAALDLALKMQGTLGDMTFAVDAMNSVRQALDERAREVAASDAVAKRSAPRRRRRCAAQKIVATKEAEITGEERLRENLTDLYSNIVFFDGGRRRPRSSVPTRIAARTRRCAARLDAWTTRSCGGINAALRSKKLEPIAVMTRQQWEAAGQ